MKSKYIKNKAVISLLVTLLLISLIGVNLAVGDKGPAVKTLTLKEATDLAMKNNPDVKIADLGVKKSELEHKNAKYNSDKLDVDYVNTYQLGLVKWVAPKEKENALALAKKQAEVSKKSIMFDVENRYYNVLKAERNLTIKREALKYFQDQLKVAQAAYKVGTKAKLDVNTIEAAVAGSQAEVTGEENNYRTALMELNRIIGLDLDTQLKLTTQFTIQKTGNSIKVEEVIKKALEDNIEILIAKNVMEISKLNYDTAKKFYMGGVTVLDTADIDSQVSQAKLAKQELATTSSVRQNYLTLFSLEKVLDWNQKEVAKAEENARIYKLKYEAGLATSLDVKKAALDLEEAKQNLTENIFKYNLLKSQFKYELFSSGAASSASATSSGY